MTLDLDRIREELESERDRLRGALHTVNHSASLTEETGDLSIGQDDHIADSASETFMRELDGGLEENAEQSPDANAMLAALLNDHEALVRNLREDLATAAELGDAGTNDFLTGLMEQHEKTAWMLRAYLR